MGLDELYLNLNNCSFADLVCQNEIQSDDDKQSLAARGYFYVLTEAEFVEQTPGIDPDCIYYTPSLSTEAIYFNKETFAANPFPMSFLVGLPKDDPQGLTGYKKVIALREQEVADKKYLGSAISFPDAMRLEYFKKLLQK